MKQAEVKMDLRGKHLTAIPDSVFKITELTHLDLGSINTTFFPPLSALKDSNSNNILSIPEDIGKLTKLRTLILNTNSLTNLPTSITKLADLETLDLSINKELDIMQQLNKLSQLPKLRVLKIVDVKLRKDDIDILKSALKKDTKIILTISEYMEASKHPKELY